MWRMGWAALVCGAVLASAASARADDSSQGPFYVEGSLGASYWDFPGNTVVLFGIPFAGLYSWTGFWPSLEVGLHPTGRHDGIVLGLRQAFIITATNIFGAHAAGTTSIRVGYDLAFKAGSLEVNVDPFATVGVGYVFDGPHAGIGATGGIDVKLFFVKGVFAFVRPGELGFQCFEDLGNCAFSYAVSGGGGVAFGQ